MHHSVYGLTKGLTSRMLQNLIFAAMEQCRTELADLLPARLMDQQKLMPIWDALVEVHHPTTQGGAEVRQRAADL